MDRIFHALIGDPPGAVDTAIKASALFLTAAILFRFMERRTLAEFAPFDWIAAVAAGAIVGRAATASDTSWLNATAALISLLVAHAVLARLRFIPGIRRFIDPPLKVLIRNGQVDRRNLRRCGLTIADLEAVLRQHGHESSDRIHLAIFEAKGAISILLTDGRGDRHGSRVGKRRSDSALGAMSSGTSPDVSHLPVGVSPRHGGGGARAGDELA